MIWLRTIANPSLIPYPPLWKFYVFRTIPYHPHIIQAEGHLKWDVFTLPYHTHIASLVYCCWYGNAMGGKVPYHSHIILAYCHYMGMLWVVKHHTIPTCIILPYRPWYGNAMGCKATSSRCKNGIWYGSDMDVFLFHCPYSVCVQWLYFSPPVSWTKQKSLVKSLAFFVKSLINILLFRLSHSEFTLIYNWWIHACQNWSGHLKTIKTKWFFCELYNNELSILTYYRRNFENGLQNVKEEFLKIRTSHVLKKTM